MGQAASKSRHSTNGVRRDSLEEEFPREGADDFIVVDFMPSSLEGSTDVASSQNSQSRSRNTSHNTENDDIFVVDLSEPEQPRSSDPENYNYSRSLLLTLTSRSYEDLTQDISRNSSYFEHKSFMTTSSAQQSPVHGSLPLHEKLHFSELDLAVRSNFLLTPRNSSTPQLSAIKDSIAFPALDNCSSPFNARGLPGAYPSNNSLSCYTTASEGQLTPRLSGSVSSREEERVRGHYDLFVSLRDITERSPRLERSCSGGPRAMPAKRVGAASTSRAEEDRRLLEPGSSREDDESPKSLNSASKINHSQGNSDTLKHAENQTEVHVSLEPSRLQLGPDYDRDEPDSSVGQIEGDIGYIAGGSNPTQSKTPQKSPKTPHKSQKSPKSNGEGDKASRSRSKQTVDSTTPGGKRKSIDKRSVEGRSLDRKSPGGVSGRSPTRAPPKPKVVYYQNRFITIPIDDPAQRSSIGGSSIASSQTSRGGAVETSSSPQTQGDSGIQQGEQDITMDLEGMPIDLDPVTPAQPVPRFGARGLAKTQSLFAKVTAVLQDNRLKSGTAEIQEQIKEMNKTQQDSHKVLKKILNIIFITTGVSLFLGVVVVIIYTSLVPQPPLWLEEFLRRKREGKPESEMEVSTEVNSMAYTEATTILSNETLWFESNKAEERKSDSDDVITSHPETDVLKPSSTKQPSAIEVFLQNKDKFKKKPRKQKSRPTEPPTPTPTPIEDTLDYYDYNNIYYYYDSKDDVDDRLVKHVGNHQSDIQYLPERHRLRKHRHQRHGT